MVSRKNRCGEQRLRNKDFERTKWGTNSKKDTSVLEHKYAPAHARFGDVVSLLPLILQLLLQLPLLLLHELLLVRRRDKLHRCLAFQLREKHNGTTADDTQTYTVVKKMFAACLVTHRWCRLRVRAAAARGASRTKNKPTSCLMLACHVHRCCAAALYRSAVEPAASNEDLHLPRLPCPALLALSAASCRKCDQTRPPASWPA